MQSGGTRVNDVIFDHHFVSALDAKLSPSNDFILTMSSPLCMYIIQGCRRGVSGGRILIEILEEFH